MFCSGGLREIKEPLGLPVSIDVQNKTKQKLEKCDGVQVVPTEGKARLPNWNFFGFFLFLFSFVVSQFPRFRFDVSLRNKDDYWK